MLITTNYLHDVNELKILLEKELDMKNLGLSSNFLGMNIHMDKSDILLWLSQKCYVDNVLEKLNTDSKKVVITQLENHFNL